MAGMETDGKGCCKYCGKTIAWRRICIPGGPSKGVNRPFEPVLDAEGKLVRREVPNGSDRHGNPKKAWRVVPTDVMHRCRTHTPAPDWTPADSTCPAPEESTPEPRSPSSAEEPEHDPTTSGPDPRLPDLDALVALLARPVTNVVRGEIVALLKSYGVEPPPQRHRFERPDGGSAESVPGEIVHVNVPRVVRYLVRIGPDGAPRPRHVYAYGPAGSGKTFGLLQAVRLAGRTDVLVVPFAGVGVGRLFGMPTVSGEWQKGLLTDAVEFGHVVVADEFDRALPQVAVTLNAVLENGWFMDGTRQVKVHPSFCLLASGNTDGRGATRTATSAQPMDQPTLARFAFVAWGYDDAHEERLVARWLPTDEAASLCKWTRKIRQITARDHVESFCCGPREASNVAEDVANGADVADACETWIWRGLKVETRERITYEAPLPRIGGAK